MLRQALTSQQTEKHLNCHVYEKSFKSERGRAQHLNSCRIKQTKIWIATSKSASKPGLEDSTPTVTGDTRSNMARLNPSPSQQSPRIRGCHTKKDLVQIVNSVYEEIWRKNVFMLPSGSAGKDFVREITIYCRWAPGTVALWICKT
jgi:hypothetical protein